MLDMLQTRLSDLASWHGVIPVPNDVLEQHKLAELRKNRGSWWYNHVRLANWCVRGGAMLSALTTGFAALSAIICLNSEYFSAARWAALVAVVGGFTCWKIIGSGAMSLQGLVVRGPAQWIEREEDPFYVTAPAPLKEMAIHIMRENTGDMHLIKGRLVQNHVTIDPYLVIRRGDDQIVLGIWDDDRIIHQATTTII